MAEYLASFGKPKVTFGSEVVVKVLTTSMVVKNCSYNYLIVEVVKSSYNY